LRVQQPKHEGAVAIIVEPMATRPTRVEPPPLERSERPRFADLAREHLDRLYGFCLRLTNHPSDAEDLVQETLIRAMRAYSSLRDVSRAKGWLFAIATNAWRDLSRARGREIRTVPIDGLDAEGDEFSLFQTIAIEDPFPYSDELHLDFLRLFHDEDVAAVFGSITPVFRLPLILTVIHGFSCKEAAAILEIPLGTLLSRLHRGRKQLERGLWDYAVANALVITADEVEP
jgi:RNA polymerase sigma-70 factor (ECF subfamily)